MTSSGGNPGSCEPDPSSTGSGPPGFDPGREEVKAALIRQNDAYLISYLLGWAGLAKPEPWGSAMSFAMEIAHAYGLIKGESDATLTPFGVEVAKILAKEPTHGN